MVAAIKETIQIKIKIVFFTLKVPDDRAYNKSTNHFKKNKIKVQNGMLGSDIKNVYKSW